MKNKCYYLSIDECAIIHYIQKHKSASFDDITMYIYLYRDRIEELMESLVSKKIIRPFEKNDLGIEPYYELEDYRFLKSKTKKITIKKPLLWRIHFFFLRLYRKIQREIFIWNDLRKMKKDKWRRIKQAGCLKEYKEKEKWAKRILKTKDISQIDIELQKKGYTYDKEQRSNHLLLNDVLYNSIGVIAEYGDWAIETIAGLPVLAGRECLNLIPPHRTSICYVNRVKK